MIAGVTPNSPSIRLVDLVEHADHLDAEFPLATAQTEFTRCGRRFLGVTDRGKFVGVASGREIGQTLSAQFGHALFGRNPVARHVMKNALVVTPETPLTEFLQKVSGRSDADFYSDIALVSETREFIGLIPVHRVSRLQTALLLENLAEVEARRREVAARNRQMEDDLRMAREVQLALLPSKPVRLEHAGRIVQTQHLYLPADVIGGDFLAVTQPAADSVGLIICDVMGHGVRPALITAIMSALIEESNDASGDPGQLLTRLNHGLLRILRSAGDLIFVTAGYAVLDLGRGELRYAQAGHPTPYLWRAKAGEAAPLTLAADSGGPALGLIDDIIFESTAVPLQCGDALLLFTDGIIEAAASDASEFGPERLAEAFTMAARREGADVAAGIVESARRFSANGKFTDDVCVLVARYEDATREMPAANSPAQSSGEFREAARNSRVDRFDASLAVT